MKRPSCDPIGACLCAGVATRRSLLGKAPEDARLHPHKHQDLAGTYGHFPKSHGAQSRQAPQGLCDQCCRDACIWVTLRQPCQLPVQAQRFCGDGDGITTQEIDHFRQQLALSSRCEHIASLMGKVRIWDSHGSVAPDPAAQCLTSPAGVEEGAMTVSAVSKEPPINPHGHGGQESLS